VRRIPGDWVGVALLLLLVFLLSVMALLDYWDVRAGERCYRSCFEAGNAPVECKAVCD